MSSVYFDELCIRVNLKKRVFVSREKVFSRPDTLLNNVLGWFDL